MDLVDPQLRDALPSTSSLAATADSTKGAHRSILPTGNKEHTAVQPRCSSQGVESDIDEICEVEALLAKSTVRNVVWYLVKPKVVRALTNRRNLSYLVQRATGQGSLLEEGARRARDEWQASGLLD